MGDNKNLPNQFANAGSGVATRCDCLSRRSPIRKFHGDRQDTAAPGWLRLLELIDEAAADGRHEFVPLRELSVQERREIVTLPPTIAKLTEVRKFVLYGSNLVRIPPEIGAMTNLETFQPYTSYRLHWFPYEITRCTRLASSTVSTRAIYGNFKTRLPFPATGDAGEVRPCSVCDGPVTTPHQVWITLVVGTDYLPLLVNACSAECVAALPKPPRDYVSTPHTGGPDVVQPSPYR